MLTHSKSILIWFLLVSWLCEPWWLAAKAQSLLPSDVQTVDITGDVMTNLTLTSGLVLSGSVRTERGDPVALGTLTARSTTGVFAASIQGGESAYRIVLPPGTYDLNLSVPFLDAEEADIPTFVYVASDAVAGLGITADTTQNLVVPTLPGLVTVEGFVTPQSTVPTSGALQFVATDGGTFTIALFEDFYTARLLPNTYNVNAVLIYTEASGAASSRTTARVQVNLDAITVNDDLTIFDATLPATVDLSGTVLDTVNALIAPARVVATVAAAETAVPSDIDFSCRPATAFSFVPVPVSGTAFIHHETGEGTPTGAYRLPLPVGTYRLGVTLGLDLQPGTAPILVDLDTSPRSILSIAAPILEVALTTSATQNLVVAALPPVVTLSGRVTDALGQPLANAAVVVMTSTLVGMSNTARFSAMSQTQDDGTYALPVLSGTSYAVMACPPSAHGLSTSTTTFPGIAVPVLR